MKGQEILEVLENQYNGLRTLNYGIRYQRGTDQKKETINWLRNMFNCSYGVAKRLVEKAN